MPGDCRDVAALGFLIILMRQVWDGLGDRDAASDEAQALEVAKSEGITLVDGASVASAPKFVSVRTMRLQQCSTCEAPRAA